MAVDAIVSRGEAGYAPEARRSALFIAWKSECFRSTQTASVFDADLLLIAPRRQGVGRWAPIRAAVLVWATLRALATRRPRLLIVLNQPPLLAAVAWLYVTATRSRLFLDSHSKVYQANYPRALRRFYSWLTPRVALNINHNGRDQKQVGAWGGKSILLEALPFVEPVGSSSGGGRITQPYILCVCSFAADEPAQAMLEAISMTPHIRFLMTGKMPQGLAQSGVPKNVTSTGYLAQADYYRTLSAASAVATFSNRDWIMQMAVEEALLYGIPVVTNRSPVLESVLGSAGVFVDITPAGMAEGFERVMLDRDARAADMLMARDRQKACVLDALYTNS